MYISSSEYDGFITGETIDINGGVYSPDEHGPFTFSFEIEFIAFGNQSIYLICYSQYQYHG